MSRNLRYSKCFRLLPAVLLCLGLLGGCLEEIKLEVPEVESTSLAIRGRLVNSEPPVISVRIVQLSNFNASSIPQPVGGASVVLIDQFNRGVDIPEREEGLHELVLTPASTDLTLAEGGTYTLSVSTPEGRNYLSEPEVLHGVPEPLDIRQSTVSRDVLDQLGNIERQDFVRFFLTTPVRPGAGERPVYFKWDFIGTYKFLESVLPTTGTETAKTCYIFELLNQESPVVFNGSESREEIIQDLFILEEPFDHRFANGFYLTVAQQSLSEGAYHYWEQIGDVLKSSGNFFETPPGKVKGNFRNVDDPAEEVFGYFYATEEKIIRYFVDLGPSPPEALCPLSAASSETIDTTCTDCLLRAGSTLMKPDFWEE